MAGRLAWFLTPAGKKFSMGCMTASSVLAFGVQYFPHTYFLYKYREFVSMYESAVPVPLNERVRKRWDEVVKDLSLPEHEVKYLEPFTVFGFDLFHAGYLESRWGAIVGIPVNFTYQDESTVDTDRIRVNNESVNWNRQDAKKLLESLILSEDAQRYGIAREILMARHNGPLYFSLLGAFMVSTNYLLCRMMNNRFQLLQRPLPVRALFYFLGCVTTFGLWITQKDLINVMWETEADTYLAQLNVRYSKGAVEFYEKMLKRNVALRSLLGSMGESTFTPLGNERHMFRMPRVPIDSRKLFFQEHIRRIKREMESLDEQDTTISAPA